MSAAPRNERRRRRTIVEDGPDPVDVHVGSRVRERRTMLGLSQEKLARAFGVSFQQVQKYERGANRISASRLHQLASILDVPMTFFFEGLPGEGDDGASAATNAGEEKMMNRETLELVRAYYRIPDQAVRKRFVDLVRAVGRDLEVSP